MSKHVLVQRERSYSIKILFSVPETCNIGWPTQDTRLTNKNYNRTINYTRSQTPSGYSGLVTNYMLHDLVQQTINRSVESVDDSVSTSSITYRKKSETCEGSLPVMSTARYNLGSSHHKLLVQGILDSTINVELRCC